MASGESRGHGDSGHGHYRGICDRRGQAEEGGGMFRSRLRLTQYEVAWRIMWRALAVVMPNRVARLFYLLSAFVLWAAIPESDKLKKEEK